MAVINDPDISTQVGRVGMGSGMVWTPAHGTSGPLPIGAGGAYRLSMLSGTIAASLAADSELFQFRFVTAASRVALVHHIQVSAASNVAAAAAALLSLRATVARAWTAAGSGGTRATLTGNNQKARTTHATSEVSDAGIATTGALTAGTKTLDSHDIGIVAYSLLTGAITVQTQGVCVPPTDLLAPGGLSFPLVLANQEGFVVRSGAQGPAGATWHLGVTVVWSEVDGF